MDSTGAGSRLIEDDALRQRLIEALTKGDGSAAASLSALLANAQLTSEQQAVFTALLSLGSEHTAASGVSGDPAPVRDDDSAAMLQELQDLREVNDTVAAALGACRFCWGGDADCGECGGRGRAGSRAPHPRLFNELVGPAVRRVANHGHSARRVPGRPAHMYR